MEELQEQIDHIVDKSINDMKIKIAKVVNRHLSRIEKEQSRNVRKSVNVSSKQPPVVKNVRKNRERDERERDDESDSDA